MFDLLRHPNILSHDVAHRPLSIYSLDLDFTGVNFQTFTPRRKGNRAQKVLHLSVRRSLVQGDRNLVSPINSSLRGCYQAVQSDDITAGFTANEWPTDDYRAQIRFTTGVYRNNVRQNHDSTLPRVKHIDGWLTRIRQDRR